MKWWWRWCVYLARENSGKELKEPNEALCRNEAEGSGISLSRSVENDICRGETHM